MDFNEFYESTKGIFLYPGSVSDLKARTGPKNNAVGIPMTYEEIELPESEQYLTGIIVPSKKALIEKLHMMQNALEAFGGMKFGGQSVKELMDQEVMTQMTPMLEQMLEQMYGNSAILATDLRLKAKTVGASGLVHVQLYEKDGLYMGVPVKYTPTMTTLKRFGPVRYEGPSQP